MDGNSGYNWIQDELLGLVPTPRPLTSRFILNDRCYASKLRFQSIKLTQMAIFPTRVVALPDGSTAFSFTMFQGPDMPDELFESQHESLKREFTNIQAAFAA